MRNVINVVFGVVVLGFICWGKFPFLLLNSIVNFAGFLFIFFLIAMFRGEIGKGFVSLALTVLLFGAPLASYVTANVASP